MPRTHTTVLPHPAAPVARLVPTATLPVSTPMLASLRDLADSLRTGGQISEVEAGTLINACAPLFDELLERRRVMDGFQLFNQAGNIPAAPGYRA